MFYDWEKKQIKIEGRKPLGLWRSFCPVASIYRRLVLLYSSLWVSLFMGQSHISVIVVVFFNTLRPWQNGRHFPDDIFVNDNFGISMDISLKFVPRGQINNSPALVQIMARCRPGDKPLSEPMMITLLTHICAKRPHRVKDTTTIGLGNPKIILAVISRPWRDAGFRNCKFKILLY